MSKCSGDPGNITAAEMQDILRPRSAWRAVRDRPSVLKRTLPFFLSLAFLFASMGGGLFLLSPGPAADIWLSASSGAPARDLLTGYLRWYQALFLMCAGGFFGNLLLALFQLGRGVRDLLTCRRLRAPVRDLFVSRLTQRERAGFPDPPPVFTQEEMARCEQAVRQAEPYNTGGTLALVGAVLSLVAVLFFTALFLTEDIAALPGRARADLAQLEAGTLETAEVFISPKCRPARLPGPYGAGQRELTMRYGVIGPDTGGEWVRVYVPHSLDFSLEGTRLYDEDRSVQWNLEHAQRYRVRWTSEFHLAEGVVPIP